MADKVKRLLLLAIASMLRYSGLLRFRLFFRRAVLRKKGICVLGLHRVLSEEQESRANSLEGIVLREATFARILEFLSQEFRIVSLDTFLRGGTNDLDESKPWCLLTFDDGWRDNYTTAFPLLKKFGMPAVIFLVTGLIGECEGFWVEKLRRAWGDPAGQQRIRMQFASDAGSQNQKGSIEAIIEHFKHMPANRRRQALAQLLAGPDEDARNSGADRMLTWEDVSAMERDGIEFEAHTVTHPLLVYEDEASVQFELQASKQVIEERLARKVRAFAYPNGAWDRRVRDAVQKADYECAFTTQRGWYCQGDDAFTIRRIMLHEAKVTGPDGQFSKALLGLRLLGWF